MNKAHCIAIQCMCKYIPFTSNLETYNRVILFPLHLRTAAPTKMSLFTLVIMVHWFWRVTIEMSETEKNNDNLQSNGNGMLIIGASYFTIYDVSVVNCEVFNNNSFAFASWGIFNGSLLALFERFYGLCDAGFSDFWCVSLSRHSEQECRFCLSNLTKWMYFSFWKYISLILENL